MKHISDYLDQSPLVQEAKRRDLEQTLEEQRIRAEAIRNRKRLRVWRSKVKKLQEKIA